MSLRLHLVTGRNEVVAKVIFYTCLSFCSRGGGAIPACIAGGIPACLAAGLQGEGLQAHTQGGSLEDLSREGGACPRGVPAPGECDLLLWPSVVVFCYALLVRWPSD